LLLLHTIEALKRWEGNVGGRGRKGEFVGAGTFGVFVAGEFLSTTNTDMETEDVVMA
jgi:hypothetical protein